MKIGAMNHPKVDVFSEIERVAEEGFDFIDLTYEAPSRKGVDAYKIKRALQEMGIGVVGHSNPSLPAVYPLKEVREACFNKLVKTADFFAAIGADRMNIHPFTYGGHLNEEEITLANIELLKRLSPYCRERNITLMIENYRPPFASPEMFQRLIAEVPGLKSHLDIGHLNLSGNFEKNLEGFLNFGKDIIHCHIHDNRGDKDLHLPLGCGSIDWADVVKKLKESGYDGTVTLEVFCPTEDYLLFSKNRWYRLWNN